ncbi:hypothetical protein HYV50_00095 [Candidatus Pacearchaeota archaeon]|nr:hypothetical protein [Candidatus Pacearchaeota archaeon]
MNPFQGDLFHRIYAGFRPNEKREKFLESYMGHRQEARTTIDQTLRLANEEIQTRLRIPKIIPVNSLYG